MRLALLRGVCAAALCACAADRASSPTLPPAHPALGADGRWTLPSSVERARARERGDLPRHRVRLGVLPGAPEVELPGLVPPTLLVTSRTGLGYVKALLDEDVVAECLVRVERMDLAGAFQQAFVSLSNQPAVREVHADRLAARAVDGFPVLSLVAESLVGGGHYAALQLAGAHVRDTGVFCSAEAVGHRRTFASLVDALVRGLARALQENGVQRTFHWVTVEPGWSGMVEHVARVREDGVHVEMDFLSLLHTGVPLLSVVDEVGVEVTAPGGALVLQRALRQVDHQVQRDVTVAPSEQRRALLHREGKGRTRDLGPVLPTSGRQVRAGYVDALRTGRAAGVALRYVPAMEENELVEESVELVRGDARGGVFTAFLQARGRRADARFEVDGDGAVVRSTVRWEGATLSMVRVR